VSRIDFSKLPVWEKMGTISLDEMDSIKLMNRIDSKYMCNEAKLVEVLNDAADMGYRACVIGGQKVTEYYSVYYDTADLKMYFAHHNGRKVRQKVRVRTYLVSGLTYLEIKKKNNKGRTKKKRIAIPEDIRMNFGTSEEAADFLAKNSWWTEDQLSPEATTEFNRITLVNAAKTERLTIDTNLHFHNFRSNIDADLRDAVIIELKQDGRAESQMKTILLKHRIFPFGVSKYCIATALTEPGVKKRKIQKENQKNRKNNQQ